MFQDDFHIKFVELARSDLPNLAKIDVEMSDKENLVSLFLSTYKRNVFPFSIERELALLVALQGESIWKGWGGLDTHSIRSRWMLVIL